MARLAALPGEPAALPSRYAFRVVKEDWALFGEGPQWPTVDFNGNYDDEVEVGLARVKMTQDPTNYGLVSLLTTDAVELTDGSVEFWLALEFGGLGGNSRVFLPLELHTENEPEVIAQINIEDQLSTGSPENMRLAKYWLRNCMENHPRCRLSAGAEPSGWLPTRLLCVGSETSQCLRLVCTSMGGLSNVQYAALSYRWGDQEEFVLTSAKLESYCSSILLSDLPATLQDAVQACRGIGLEYLWVDALCIVQDDAEDWERESAVMSKVYGLATCSIVAAANNWDPDSGCFARRNPYQVRPCLIPNPFNPASSKLRFSVRSQYMKDIFEQEVRQSGWYSRGWVFQERTLSSRLLIFGQTQMLWACQELQAAETWPSGKTSENFIDQFESFEVEKGRLQKLLDPSRYISAVDDLWPMFLRDYAGTGNNFTRMSDRLVALQGLVSQIRASTGHQYCAGFWLDRSLPASLLWRASNPRVPRPREPRAPSWSWASVDGPIRFNLGRFKGTAAISLVQVLDLERYQSSPLDFPRLEIQVSGRLLRVTIVMEERLVEGMPQKGFSLAVYKNGPEEEVGEELAAHDLTAPKSSRREKTREQTQRLVQKARELARKARYELSDISHIMLYSPRGYSLQLIRKIPWRPLRMVIALPVSAFWKSYESTGRLLVKALRALLAWLKKTTHGSDVEQKISEMVPSIESRTDLRLGADCFYDFPLSQVKSIMSEPTFIIPVLTGYRISGLIVQPAPGLEGIYERIGVFEMGGFGLERFALLSELSADQILSLI